jgi:hypothetical protein
MSYYGQGRGAKCALCDDAGMYRGVSVFGRRVALPLCESHGAYLARLEPGAIRCAAARHDETPPAAAYRADYPGGAVDLCAGCWQGVEGASMVLVNRRPITSARAVAHV